MAKLQPMLFDTLKNYSKKQFLNDLVAGIIVSIIALPLSIALAISSGVSPEQGLYTAIIGGFLISFLGGSRVQIGGPTGAFMVIVYGIISSFGIEGLITATIMAGFILILFGLFKLGGVIKYIPYPLTTGFTAGIALTIFSSQIKDFFGLSIEKLPADFLEKWEAYFEAIKTINIQAVIIGIIALIIIILWPRVTRKIPGSLVAIIVTTIIVSVFKMDVNTIGKEFGELSSSLPTPRFPKFTFETISELIRPAFTIALLGGIESLLSSVVSDGMIGSKHRSDMELVAQGVANMASGVFGGIPATGAIARTVANIENGGRTPVSGMVHALMLLLILVTLMPLAKMIPLATLASVLMVVAYNMSSWREFKHLFKAPKSDIIVLIISFVLTVVFDLVIAIEIGVVLAAILFMKRMSEVSHIKSLDTAEEDFHPANIPNSITVYDINGPFFFGAADKFIEILTNIHYPTKVIILQMKNVPAIDATALHAFKQFINICKQNNITLFISGINNQPLNALKKSLVYEEIGEKQFYKDVNEAIKAANELVK